MQRVMRCAFDRIRIRNRVPGRSDPTRGFDRSTIRTRHCTRAEERLDGDQPEYRTGLVFRGLKDLRVRW